jgi:hypothetical protein
MTKNYPIISLNQKKRFLGKPSKPKVNDAFDAFVEKIAEPDRRFIQLNKTDILSAFDESEIGSLRVLRQAINNAVRLRQQFTSKQSKDPVACRALLRLTLALDFEIKAGRLNRDDFRNRKQQEEAFGWHRAVNDLNKEAQDAPPKFVDSNSRYKTIQLDDEAISDELLIQMLFDGFYDTAAIRACINKSIYFADATNIPPWRTFTYFDRLSDDDIETALSAIELQLSERSCKDVGELLHIFSLRLMMVENKIINQNYADVVRSSKEYIDALVDLGNLPKITRFETKYRNAHDGVSFWITDKYRNEFLEIRLYLSDAIKRAWALELPLLAKNLLKLVKSNSEEFYNQLCHTSDQEGQYVNIPIFASIDAKEFVDDWMHAHPENWYYISGALKDRSINVRPGSDLQGEEQWMRDVVRLLEEYEKTKSGVSALRIRRIIPQLNLLALQG